MNPALLSTVSFISPVETQIASGLFPVAHTAIGDLNSDGIPDLIASRNDSEAQIYLGTSTGAFNGGPAVATGSTPIALGDFNNDGKLDLATSAGVLPGLGNGTFGAVVAGFTLPSNTVNLYAQDVNSDGNLDLIAATFTTGTGVGQTQNPVVGESVLLGLGNGTFKSALSGQVGSAAGLNSAAASFAFADFNNDGHIDAVTPFGVMLANTDGSYGRPIPLPFKAAGSTVTPDYFAIGDFNGDSNFDLATLPASGAAGAVEIFTGDGKALSPIPAPYKLGQVSISPPWAQLI